MKQYGLIMPSWLELCRQQEFAEVIMLISCYLEIAQRFVLLPKVPLCDPWPPL